MGCSSAVPRGGYCAAATTATMAERCCSCSISKPYQEEY
jgi:hypothetical protein